MDTNSKYLSKIEYKLILYYNKMIYVHKTFNIVDHIISASRYMHSRKNYSRSCETVS